MENFTFCAVTNLKIFLHHASLIFSVGKNLTYKAQILTKLPFELSYFFKIFCDVVKTDIKLSNLLTFNKIILLSRNRHISEYYENDFWPLMPIILC